MAKINVTNMGGRHLTVGEMVNAGVAVHIAKRAHADVHTPEHARTESKRADLVNRLVGKGYDLGQIKTAVAKSLAGRVSVGSPRPTLRLHVGD